jgi:hypothetical protein
MNPNVSRLEEHLGQKSLYLRGGIAYLKDVQFTDGIIEFDVAFSRDRGFFGGVFRMQDPKNYEEFYLRAHQSGNPDALQYTPVYNGMAGWQLYQGKGFGAKTSFRFDTWMHVKLVVSGKFAELYIDDESQPVLFMHDLKRRIKPGLVGVKVPAFAAGHFANFRVTPMKNPLLKLKAVNPADTEPGTITAWQVSNAFSESSLQNKTRLSAADKESLTWEALSCERSGLANLSRLVGRTAAANTVFAKIIIESDEPQIKGLDLGFSDRVKVFLNDRLLYAGLNNYRSRDYRYLGTIGYFDRVFLPLEKGKNELWLAVSEDFGGWGIKGRFNDMNGITFH